MFGFRSTSPADVAETHHAVAIRSGVGEATDRVYRAHEPHVLIQAGRDAATAVSASGAGRDACSRQSEAVSAPRPRWRAKNRAELSRSYSGTG